MAMDAGLTYWGDVDAIYDMPREKRVKVLACLKARKEPELAGWACGIQAADIAHLLAQVLGGGGGKPQDERDLMAGLLAQLDDPGD